MKRLSTKQAASCTSGDAAGRLKAQEVGRFEHETSYFLHQCNATGRGGRLNESADDQRRSGGSVGGKVGLL